MWVGGLADSQTRSKLLKPPPQITPKIAFFDPNFTFRFPKSYKTLGWVNRFGKGFPKKTFFFIPSLTLFWCKFMNKAKYAFCVLLGWKFCVCYFLGISHVWHYWLMRRRHAKAGHPSKPMPYNSCFLHFGDGTSDYNLSWIKAPEVMYFDPTLRSDVTLNLIICIAIQFCSSTSYIVHNGS